MLDSHCENLWSDNSGNGMGCHTTSDYGEENGVLAKKLIISQQRLRSNILSLWIKNSLINDENAS